MLLFSHKTIIFCGALFYITQSFAMLTLPKLMHNRYNIKSLIYNQLPHENQKDFRLTCTEFARKNKDWDFMPNDIEKETDYHHKKYGKLTEQSKGIIFVKYVFKNDYNAVQWILNRTIIKKTNISLKDHNNIHRCLINITMFAKSNNNEEMVHFLMSKYVFTLQQDGSLQERYNNITPPLFLQELLPTSQVNDFTYLQYIMAVMTDNSQHLQQLFDQQVPTSGGINILFDMCFSEDSIDCFKFFLTNATAQKSISRNKDTLISIARYRNAHAIKATLEQLFPTTVKPKPVEKESCIIQ